MKKIHTLLLSFLFIVGLHAQAPPMMSYQAVIRDANNQLVNNKSVIVDVSIIQGNVNNTPTFRERHTTQTNDNGLMTLQIGSGISAGGGFNLIDWGNGPYFIKTETYVGNTTNSTAIVGTQQLLSVPYALYAESTSYADCSNYIVLAGDITDAEAEARLKKEIGPCTQFIWILNTSRLTKLKIPRVKRLVGIRLELNENLESVEFTDLTDVWSDITIDENSSLKRVIMDSLNNATGNLNIVNNRLTAIRFPNLRAISREMEIYNNHSLLEISFPQLKLVGKGISIIGNNVSSDINISLLESAQYFILGGNTIAGLLMSNNLSQIKSYISIYSNADLKSIDLPSLKSCGDLSIGDNDQLNFFGAKALLTSGNLDIFRNEMLSMIDLANLNKASNIGLQGNSRLGIFATPKLVLAEGINFYYDNLILSEIDMPLLKACGNIAISNPLLESVYLASLQQAGSVNFYGNPKLTYLKVSMLKSCQDIQFYDNANIKDLLFASLIDANNIYIDNNSISGNVDFSSLKSCQDIRLNNNSNIKDLLFTSLAEAKNIYIDHNSISGNADLSSLKSCQDFQLNSHPNMKKLLINNLIEAKNIYIYGNSISENLDFSSLKSCQDFQLSNNPNMKSLQINNLSEAKNIYIYGNSISGILNLQSLTTNDEIIIINNDSLKSIAANLLDSSSIIIDDNSALLGISFGTLKYSNYIRIIANASLNNINLTALEKLDYLRITDNYALTNLSIPALNSYQSSSLILRDNNLDTNTVNSLLHQFTLLNPPLSNCYISLYQIPPAPPTGQGLIDKQTLINNGNIVETD